MNNYYATPQLINLGTIDMLDVKTGGTAHLCGDLFKVGGARVGDQALLKVCDEIGQISQ